MGGGEPGESESPDTETPKSTATPTESPTATPTTEETPTSTSTQTPEPEPSFVQANPVTGWETHGDVIDNYTRAFGNGGNVFLASRQEVPIVDGKVDTTVQCDLYDGDERIDRELTEVTELIDEPDGYTNETGFWFSPERFERGTYGAEIIVQDNHLGNRVRTNRIEFDIVDPLVSHEVAIVERDIPDTIVAGEPFSYEVVIENVSDRDSSIVSEMEVTENYSRSATLDDK